MNYQETLDYLFSQLPMYQRQGKAAYKADLNNTWALMDILGQPQQKFKNVHVGGTNGKGSTSHLLASILQEAGYKVGLYTSPHLLDFRERIKINGKMISEQEVVSFVNNYKADFEKINLSFFEWTVGLAFHYFAKQKVDIAIVEVGMGGRLDSTNVLQPLLSVITNISLDHTQFLGNCVEQIATEKAGIIKANTPVVIGETSAETKPVFQAKAKEQNAPILFTQELTFKANYPCELKGKYQIKNQKTTLTCLPLLKNNGFKIKKIEVSNGFKNAIKNTGLLGRWQILKYSPTTICDTAHNHSGLSEVLNQIKELSIERQHFVIGMVNDKEISGLLKLFPKNANYYFCKANIARALESSELTKLAQKIGLKGGNYGTVKNALSNAKQNAKNEDLIFIGGSTFVVAEALNI